MSEPPACGAQETQETVGRYTIKRRYSLSHAGWFWTVEARVMGDSLYESKYSPKRRSMERGIRRAIRRFDRMIAKAQREVGNV